ncbi:GNAT family N-acetyltransferase [Chitinophaga pendula]|uniref:GNAT family N-acetyltransferase n=1 Tax=Chitinophaga TaxID=79328 RepID=UPI0018E01FCA|nr:MULTISPECIES: GNAT family N-acetyltransferase [Chitinophaga]UCJ10030.1 GNAT family N-acetyltransferase [Chitinophaga pendula]
MPYSQSIHTDHHTLVRQLGEHESPPYALLLLADPSQEMVDRYLDEGQVYMSVKNNETTGVYVLLDTGDRVAEIKNIAVHISWQGRGVGRILLRHAVSVARAQQLEALEICTGNSSIYQLRLYQQCGFRMVAIEPDHFTRHYPEPIIENGIVCRDLIRLRMELS